MTKYLIFGLGEAVVIPNERDKLCMKVNHWCQVKVFMSKKRDMKALLSFNSRFKIR